MLTRSTPKTLVSNMRCMTSSLSAAKKPPGLAMARVVDHQRHVWRQRGGIDLARTAGKQLSHKCQANAAIGTGNGPWHGHDQAAVSLTAAIKALARAA